MASSKEKSTDKSLNEIKAGIEKVKNAIEDIPFFQVENVSSEQIRKMLTPFIEKALQIVNDAEKLDQVSVEIDRRVITPIQDEIKKSSRFSYIIGIFGFLASILTGVYSLSATKHDKSNSTESILTDNTENHIELNAKSNYSPATKSKQLKAETNSQTPISFLINRAIINKEEHLLPPEIRNNDFTELLKLRQRMLSLVAEQIDFDYVLRWCLKQNPAETSDEVNFTCLQANLLSKGEEIPTEEIEGIRNLVQNSKSKQIQLIQCLFPAVPQNSYKQVECIKGVAGEHPSDLFFNQAESQPAKEIMDEILQVYKTKANNFVVVVRNETGDYTSKKPKELKSALERQGIQNVYLSRLHYSTNYLQDTSISMTRRPSKNVDELELADFVEHILSILKLKKLSYKDGSNTIGDKTQLGEYEDLKKRGWAAKHLIYVKLGKDSLNPK